MSKKDFFKEVLGKTFEEFEKEASPNSASGDYSTSASSGDYSTSASSGNYSTSASSGNYSTSASSGYSSRSASSGNSSTSASSGNSSRSASSGNYSRSASSGNSSTSASSGNSSRSACDGEFSSATANGFFGAVKGTTKGSVLMAVEFDKDYKPIGGAVGIVGKDVEADKWYVAHEGKLKELIEVDGIKSILLSRKGNVMKVLDTSFNELYIVTDGNGKYAHGKTIKEAKDDLIYKIGNRDKSEFEHLTFDSILTFEESIEAYRVITGACGAGVRSFIESNGLKKQKYKVSEIIELTENAYGGVEFRNFINKNK